MHPSTGLSGVKSSSPVPFANAGVKEAALLHHHHAPRSTGPKHATPVVIITPKSKKSVSSQAVYDSVASRERRHLGEFLYNVTLKPVPRRSHAKTSYVSTPEPLPRQLVGGNENCTLLVKIPRVHLTPSAREELTARRSIWGTEVYTDDSDVVAACIHDGWIRGEWGDDIDASLLDLNQPTTKPRKSKTVAAADPAASLEVLTSRPEAPVPIPVDRDLHVTVLILPALEKYSGMTRFGMTSREWGAQQSSTTLPLGHKPHDGISFAIHSVRWVDGAAPVGRLRGRARRDRIRKAMGEVNKAQLVDVVLKEVSPAAVDGRANKPAETREGQESTDKMDVDEGQVDQENGDKVDEDTPASKDAGKENQLAEVVKASDADAVAVETISGADKAVVVDSPAAEGQAAEDEAAAVAAAATLAAVTESGTAA